MGGITQNENGGGNSFAGSSSFGQQVIIGPVPSTPAGYSLYVANGILAEKVKVAIKTSANWADYVFDKNYTLPSLANIEQYIKKNKHLPGIPPAAEVVKDGIDLAEMNAKLLAKVEELTLHVISISKKVAAQDKIIQQQQKKITALQNR
jgi:trimeric autotransporter adhesin